MAQRGVGVKSVVLAREQQILPVGHHPDIEKAGGKSRTTTTIIATLEAEKTPREADICLDLPPLPEDLAVGGGRGRAIRGSSRGIYTNAHKWKQNSSVILTVCDQGPGSTTNFNLSRDPRRPPTLSYAVTHLVVIFIFSSLLCRIFSQRLPHVETIS